MTDRGVEQGVRTTAILHMAETSGPSKSMRPGLERLARFGSLEVVVPGPGGAARDYAGIAQITPLRYRSVTFPRRPGQMARAVHGLGAEVRGFRRHLRRSAPDLVVVGTSTLPAALIAARLEGLPTIARIGEIFDKGRLHGRGRAAAIHLAMSSAAHLADAVVCSSDTIASQFAGRDRVSTIYPGIALDHGEGDGPRLRRAFELLDAWPLIAVVGNITEGRGQDIAIRALPGIIERFPNATCIFAGVAHPREVDLAYRQELGRLAHELGVADRVRFAGFLERVADVYAAADVLVNPARFAEPFGRVAFEALLAGCPPVVARVGAVPEVLNDREDALLVPPDDPRAVLEAVTTLVEDRALARAIASRGRLRVTDEFSEERVAWQFATVAAEVLTPERRAETTVRAARRHCAAVQTADGSAGRNRSG